MRESKLGVGLGAFSCLLSGVLGFWPSADPSASPDLLSVIHRPTLSPSVFSPPNDLVAKGSNGAVVAAEPHAAAIGLQVLKNGGNAVDAAVATAAALAVTHPQAGNLGGGGFMIIRMADGTSVALDFREMAPAAADRDMYLREDGTVDPDLSLWHALASGVPGSPAGWIHALEKHGTMPLEKLLAPAIQLAELGFPVSHFLAGSLASKVRVFQRFPSTTKIFWRKDGEKEARPLRNGEFLKQPELGATLRRLAKDGFDGFYGGETARLIAAQMERDGGIMTVEDLANYKVASRNVLRGAYRGTEVLTMPPPSSGGVALIQMLNILEAYDVRAAGWGSSRGLHLLTEAMRRAYADRARWLGDPDHYPVPTAGLVAKDYAATLREGLSLERTKQVAAGRPAGAKEGDDTTHLSVIDADGNAVSMTTTLNSTFGSGLVVDGAGFLLNNEMDDFSAKPGVPNQFGLVGGEANAIEPGKRMLSSMTPSMLVRDDKVVCVLGSPGGGRIINTVLQVAINVVDHQMPLPRAVAAPRIHHQWKPDRTMWEPLSLVPDVREKLTKMGHTFAPKSRTIGRCQAIALDERGNKTAVADPRSGGAARAY